MWQNPEEDLIVEKTLLTETDSEKSLKTWAKRDRNKIKEELYDLPSSS